jgi:chromosome segregation ATPase
MPMNLIKLYGGLELPRTQHAEPLISLIQYDPKFEIIMKFVFGRILLVRGMEHFIPPPIYGSENWKSQNRILQVS